MNRKRVAAFILAVCSFVLLGRWWIDQHDFTDVTRQLVEEARPLLTPRGDYENVAWLPNQEIAYLYAPQRSEAASAYQVYSHSLLTGAWRNIPIPKPVECSATWLNGVLRLPNGKLAVIHMCTMQRQELSYRTGIIYMWDMEENAITVLQRYPENFWVGAFAFSPDMTRLIQEQPVGVPLDNELYWVESNGHMVRLFSDWQRVRSPTWSPNGSEIAFVGTEKYPVDNPNSFWSWPSIEGLYNSPWDLYLMDANAGSVRRVLSGIRYAVAKWSPREAILTFSGEYKGTDGIWVLNLETSRVTRLWPVRTFYDWSPDAKQMVIIKKGNENGANTTQPVIVQMPDFK